jgi:hypothetical protein
MIEAALKKFNFDHFIDNIVEIIVFDAIIGNGDRHQENWAIINQFTQKSKSYKELEEYAKQENKNGRASLSKVISMAQELKISYHKLKGFAPIYDNGSSLGRELTAEKVEQLLKSTQELEKYISRGKAEIHWQGKKVSHFELIQNVLNSPYGEKVKTVINRVTQAFDGPKIAQIIQTIDEKVPEIFASYRIPASRKQLITKIITLRIEKLCALIHEGI